MACPERGRWRRLGAGEGCPGEDRLRVPPSTSEGQAGVLRTEPQPQDPGLGAELRTLRFGPLTVQQCWSVSLGSPSHREPSLGRPDHILTLGPLGLACSPPEWGDTCPQSQRHQAKRGRWPLWCAPACVSPRSSQTGTPQAGSEGLQGAPLPDKKHSFSHPTRPRSPPAGLH